MKNRICRIKISIFEFERRVTNGASAKFVIIKKRIMCIILLTHSASLCVSLRSARRLN